MSKSAVVAEVLEALMEAVRKKKARDVLKPKALAPVDNVGEAEELGEDDLVLLMGELSESPAEEG